MILSFVQKMALGMKALDVLSDVAKLVESVLQGRNPNVNPLAIEIFHYIPQRWKHPLGPCKLEEFSQWLYSGIQMFQKN